MLARSRIALYQLYIPCHGGRDPLGMGGEAALTRSAQKNDIS